VAEAVRLTVVPDSGEAEVICGMLRLEGIACSYRTTNISAEQGLMFGGWREVLVDEADLERARTLLPRDPSA
jgi:hypothetical protein